MADRLEQLLKFHETDPEDTFCTYSIAMEHAKRGEGEAALAWFERTLKIDGDYAYAWYQKASLLNDLGREEEARAAVKQGLAAAERSGDSHAADELATLADVIG